MPQMAPMSWMLLISFFSTMILMTNIMNYYLYKPEMGKETTQSKINSDSLNWKW